MRIRRQDPSTATATAKPRQSAEPKLLMLQVDGLAGADFDKAQAEKLTPNMTRRIQTGQLKSTTYEAPMPSQTVVSQSGAFYGVLTPANQWFDKKDWSYYDTMGLKQPDLVEHDLASRADSAPTIAGGHTYMSPLTGGAKKSFFAVSQLTAAKRNEGAIGMARAVKWKAGQVAYAAVHRPGDTAHALTHGEARHMFSLDDVPADKRNDGTIGLVLTAAKQFGHVMFALGQHPGQVVHTARNFVSDTRDEYQVYHSQQPDQTKRKVLLHSMQDSFISGVVADASVRSIIKDMKNGIPRMYIDFENYDNRNHQAADPAFSRRSLPNVDRNLDLLMKAADKYHYPYVIYADHGCCPGEKFEKLNNGQTFAQFLTASLPDKLPPTCKGPDGQPLPPFKEQDFGSGTGIYFTSTQDPMDRNGINKTYPGVIDKVKANPYVAFVMTRDGADTVLESPTGTTRINGATHEVKTTGVDPLQQFGEGKDMALRLHDMAHRAHQSDMMVMGKALGDDQTVNFGVLPGLHGGIGGHQQAPMIAYAPDMPLDPSTMHDSRDLRTQALAAAAARQAAENGQPAA